MPKYTPKTPSLPTPKLEVSMSQPQLQVPVPTPGPPGGMPHMSLMAVSAPMQQQPQQQQQQQHQPLSVATSAPSRPPPGISTPTSNRFTGPPQSGVPTRMPGPPFQGLSPGLLPRNAGNSILRPPLLPQMGQLPGQIPGLP